MLAATVVLVTLEFPDTAAIGPAQFWTLVLPPGVVAVYVQFAKVTTSLPASWCRI